MEDDATDPDEMKDICDKTFYPHHLGDISMQGVGNGRSLHS